MRTGCFKRGLALVLLFHLCCYAQKSNDPPPSREQNVRELGTLYITKQSPRPFSLDHRKNFIPLEDQRSFFYLDFEVSQAYLEFELINSERLPQSMVLGFSYPFLEDVILYRRNGQQLESIGHIGLWSGTKPTERRWKMSFTQAPGASTYLLVVNKSQGKPLATDISLYSPEAYGRISGFQNTFVGIYLGLALLSIFFALFIFGLTKYRTFLLYSIYLVALTVYLGAFLGYTNLFLPLENLDLGRTIYGVAIDISAITFVFFAQRLLQAKYYLPNLKKVIEAVIVVLIVLRVVWHLKFNFWTPGQIAFFMKSWYGIICFLVGAIVVQIFVYLRHNAKIGAYFALSYLFMTVGSVLMILHHSFGLLKITFYGLSHLLFASMVEIVLLSITIALIVGKIYGDRNLLANQLVLQQQKFLNAVVQGQEEERKRLGAELHDNIGSRIAHIKRLFDASYTDLKIQTGLDQISEDIRNMAHSITPSEIALVGLSEALAELLEDVRENQAMEVNFNTFQFPEQLDGQVATHLFRIVQELLQNALKHADAQTITIQLFGHEDSITLSFEDDGQGMDPKLPSKGLGLASTV